MILLPSAVADVTDFVMVVFSTIIGTAMREHRPSLFEDATCELESMHLSTSEEKIRMNCYVVNLYFNIVERFGDSSTILT